VTSRSSAGSKPQSASRPKTHSAVVGSPSIRLSPRQSSAKLLHLLHESQDPRAFAAICDAIVLHPAANETVLKAIVDLSAGSTAVLNAVATSGRASEPLLRRLARSRSPSVREHARFNLLTKRLEHSTPAEVISTLKRSRGMTREALESYLASARRSRPETLDFISRWGHSDAARAEASRRLKDGSKKARRR